MNNTFSPQMRIQHKIERIGFINGVYTPWFNGNYGSDIGYSIIDDYKICHFDEECIKEVLFNCKAVGFDMTKIWLNENLEGMLFSDSGSVTGVEPVFYENLDKLCNIAYQCGIDIGFCIVAHAECVTNKHLYDKCMRYVQIPEETEHYIDNWLLPVLELTKKYSNIILIDIYAEPEADASIWENVSRGTNWVTMERFINRVHDAVKEFDSSLATTVSSGTACRTIKKGLYNKLNVDYIGADIYSNNAEFDSPEDLLLCKPFLLGEYGCGDIHISDEDQIMAVRLMIERCKENFVKGAFYWNYGWRNNEDAGEAQLVYPNGEFRPIASYLHYIQEERNKQINGSVFDIPSLLYIRSCENKIAWFESRGAKEHILLKKSGLEWEKIVLTESDSSSEYPLVKYLSIDVADGDMYKICAVMPNGEKIFSKTVTVGKVGLSDD